MVEERGKKRRKPLDGDAFGVVILQSTTFSSDLIKPC